MESLEGLHVTPSQRQRSGSSVAFQGELSVSSSSCREIVIIVFLWFEASRHMTKGNIHEKKKKKDMV
ncbi:hypothetical protein GQ457_05G035730 [Hibiscus cannabinus]